MGLHLRPRNAVRKCSAEHNDDREHNQQHRVDAWTGRIRPCPRYAISASLVWRWQQIAKDTLDVALHVRPCPGRLWNFGQHVGAITTEAAQHVQRHCDCLRCLGAYSYTNACIDHDTVGLEIPGGLHLSIANLRYGLVARMSGEGPGASRVRAFVKPASFNQPLISSKE